MKIYKKQSVNFIDLQTKIEELYVEMESPSKFADGETRRTTTGNYKSETFSFDSIGYLAPSLNSDIETVLDPIDGLGVSYYYATKEWSDFTSAAIDIVQKMLDYWTLDSVAESEVYAVSITNGGTDQHEIEDYINSHLLDVINTDWNSGDDLDADKYISAACEALGWFSVPESASLSFDFEWRMQRRTQ